MIVFFTLLNTLAIAVIFYKLQVITVRVYKNHTFWNKTVTGYSIFIGKFRFRIPVRNRHKVELREEIERMIACYSEQNKLQTLSAKFSWLKTWDQVRQFEKDYSVVDRKIVERLVANFSPKH